MLKFIGSGWAQLEVGDKVFPVSYITDAPLDVLDSIIFYKSNHTCSIYFDGEGNETTLIITPYTGYIIHEEETAELIKINKSSDEIINELINDVVTHKTEWMEFLINEEDDNTLEEIFEDKIQKIFTLYSKDEIER